MKKILRGLTPPLIWDTASKLKNKIKPPTKQIATQSKSSSQNLQIEYEVINSSFLETQSSSNNCQGTHLNESGSTEEVEDYIKDFSIDNEIKIPSVADNLFFLEKFIAPLIVQNASVIDIGCGIGKYGKVLKRKEAITQNWQYTGVERTSEILKYAKLYCPEFQFISSDNSIKIPCQDNSHDLVMASSMLQYTLDEWVESLKEMLRISKKYVYISRLPIVRQYSSCYCHQTVKFSDKLENHYFKIFNRQEFEDIIVTINGSIIQRDYGQEILHVKGIREPIILNQYLIAKN